MRAIIPVSCLLVSLLAASETSAQAPYEIVDLTEVASRIGVVQSEARDIDDDGKIVGFELVEAYHERAIVWEGDSVRFLPKLQGDNSNLALSLGPSGEVVGLSETVTIVQCGHITKIFEEQKATLWVNDQPISLQDRVVDRRGPFQERVSFDPRMDLRFARDMNSRGVIVGYARDRQGPPFKIMGFFLDGKRVHDLNELNRPMAINDRDQVVGYQDAGNDHAFLWDGGQTTNLHDDPAIGGVTSRAWDINDSGWIVGEAQFHISKPEEPTIWRNGKPERLIGEVARPQGVATAINDQGWLVGFYSDLDNLGEPFIGFAWNGQVRVDLLDLIPQNLGWEVLFPFAINERGQIVGGGVRNGTLGHAFLMTPREP